jgi:sugar lactone lactonase YvrE
MKNYNKTKLLALVALPTLLSATVLAPLAGAATLTSKNWRFEAPITGPTTISQPADITQDSAGNFWLGEPGANQIQEIKKVGSSYVPQEPLTGSGPTALLAPSSVVADHNGNLWVANTSGNSIEEFTVSNGTYTAQNPISGFNAPIGIQVDSAGNLWVANTGSTYGGSGDGGIQEVVKVSGTWTLQPEITSTNLIHPYDIVLVGANEIWASDQVNGTSDVGNILRLVKSGGTWHEANLFAPSGDNAFIGPQGVVIDKSGNAWVMNFGANSIQEISKSGSTYTVEAPIVSEGHPFNQPNGIVIDPQGNLWTANYGGNSIQEITFLPDGLASTGFSALNFTIGASLLLIFGVVATRTSRRKLAL